MRRVASLTSISWLLILIGIATSFLGMISYQNDIHFFSIFIPYEEGDLQINLNNTCILPIHLSKEKAESVSTYEVTLPSQNRALRGTFYFNNLGQLYEGSLRGEIGDQYFSVLFQGVAEIQAHLEGKVFLKTFALEEKIKGPITIKQLKEGFQIQIPRRAITQDVSKAEMQFTVVKRNLNDTCRNGMKALPTLPPFFNKLADSIQSGGIQ